LIDYFNCREQWRGKLLQNSNDSINWRAKTADAD